MTVARQRAGLARALTEAGHDRFVAWTETPLLRAVAAGDASPAALARFRHYLEQDYVYLRHYARLYARLAVQAPGDDGEQLIRLAAAVLDVELDRHREVGAHLGCDFTAVTPSPECSGYLAFLDAATADLGDGLAAMTPCIHGYGVALSLLPRGDTGPYAPWLGVYAGGDYDAVVQRHLDMLDRYGPDPDRARELFDTALDWEDRFWSQEPPAVAA